MVNIETYLSNFSLYNNMDKTKVDNYLIDNKKITRYFNEFWTNRQRQASSIHEISYRACFKPQLPHLFIQLLTKIGDVVYDPFSGRGTSIIEAGLMNRMVVSNDINPLSKILTMPRFFIPKIYEVEKRLNKIQFNKNKKADIDLSMFYHPKTESELVSLKKYLKLRLKNKKEDDIDRWIRMVATNRLTGHSPGFFSVYTLPPNQAVTQESQIKINNKLNQKPEYKDVKKIILNKTKSLLRNLNEQEKLSLRSVGETALFLTKDARKTQKIKSNSIQLTVTSPPFLNIVQYSKDNWLRCWFNSIDDNKISKRITMSKTVEDWSIVMGDVFKELFRITKPDGYVAFEVGEIKGGSINLDDHVVPLGIKAGFECGGILINTQRFTKTSNIWGVNNNNKGTNSNRVVIFKKN